MAPEVSRPKIDTTVAHPARRYDYFLGGKDNFAADRASADEIERVLPGIRIGVRANRDLLRRATRWLATDAGIRQFLDIGTGLPTADNTHQVAQGAAPDSRIVYADNDPLVLTHARALLTSSPEGRTAYLDADLNDPDAILAHPELRRTLDLTRPVAVLLVAVLHFIPGEGAAGPIVARLLEALPPGSYLVATHATQDFMPPAQAAAYQRMLDEGRSDVWTRGRAEFAALFEGLDLVEPGIVPPSEWRPPVHATPPARADVAVWSAVGRKR